MARYVRWALLVVVALLLLGAIWFRFSADPTITGLRNILHYRAVEWLGGPRVRTEELPGALVGRVQDPEGNPVAGAVVLVASPLGHTYTAESGPNGMYRIEGVPPGRYVPVAGKQGYRDALPQTSVDGLSWKHAVTARAGGETQDLDLTLVPADPPTIVADDSLVVSGTMEVATTAPLPGTALRTHFSFERAGLRVDDCYLYEPVDGARPLPTMLLVLPGPVLTWEIIPVPFAAQGFSVLAFYPLRGTDIDGDATDILTALEYLRLGRLPARADPNRLALVGASYTSLHAYRLLGQTDQVDVTLVLGGMADAFSFRHDVEMGTAHTRPPFDQVLMALGFPNRSPELYFKHSALFHLEGLPPLCVLHGVDDELVPFSQSVQLAEELTRRGHPHEFHSYEGLKHYFSTSADNATTQQMWQDSLACLRGWLTDE
jgi:dienelactone hydrolase